jgi:hypothetical protein
MYAQGRDDAYAYEGALVEREPVDGGNVRLRLVARDAKAIARAPRAHLPIFRCDVLSTNSIFTHLNGKF